MLIFVVCDVSAANEIVVGKTKRRRKQLPLLDQAPIKFGLDAVVDPTVLPERRQFHQGSNLTMQYGEIRAAHARIPIALLVSLLGRAKAVARFCQINLPVRTLYALSLQEGCELSFHHYATFCSRVYSWCNPPRI